MREQCAWNSRMVPLLRFDSIQFRRKKNSKCVICQMVYWWIHVRTENRTKLVSYSHQFWWVVAHRPIVNNRFSHFRLSTFSCTEKKRPESVELCCTVFARLRSIYHNLAFRWYSMACSFVSFPYFAVPNSVSSLDQHLQCLGYRSAPTFSIPNFVLVLCVILKCVEHEVYETHGHRDMLLFHSNEVRRVCDWTNKWQ